MNEPIEPNPAPEPPTRRVFPRPLDINWPLARELRLAGKGWPEIAAAVSAKPNSIRRRAVREGWSDRDALSLNTVKQAKRAVSRAVKAAVTRAEKRIESVITRWTNEQIADLLRSSEKLAQAGFTPEDLALLELLDRRESVRAKHVATGRKLLGLENANQQTNIEVNLGAAGDAIDALLDAPVVEVRPADTAAPLALPEKSPNGS